MQLPIRKVTFNILYDKNGRRLQPRLELSGQEVDQTFAKYSGGTVKVSDEGWLRKLKLCWFEEERLSRLCFFSFELFEVLEMLEIQTIDIESLRSWDTVMKKIALIPSENFKKLTIITDSPLNQHQLEQLTDSLGLIKQNIAVEVRLKCLTLGLEISYQS